MFDTRGKFYASSFLNVNTCMFSFASLTQTLYQHFFLFYNMPIKVSL